jgi:predicted dehydrogenase
MIRLAMVGTGVMAGLQARAFAQIKGCKIVAACDVDEARVKAFAREFSIPNYYTDLDAQLAQKGIDAVSNVTPDALHSPVSLKIIAAGKHILCEKPLALNYAEGMGMVKAAEKAHVVNMVHLTYRNAPATQMAHELVAQGKLGEIVHLDACYFQSWLAGKSARWRTDPRLMWRLSSRHGSKGVLGDLGVHIVDLASFAAGKIISVNAHLKAFQAIKGKRHGEYVLDANDSAMIQAEFENGALGTIQTTRWAVGHINTVQLRLYGTKGALRLDLDQAKDKLQVSLGKDAETGRWKTLRCPKNLTIYERFLQAIRTGKNGTPSFRRGAEIQAVLDACFVSDEKQARIGVSLR